MEHETRFELAFPSHISPPLRGEPMRSYDLLAHRSQIALKLACLKRTGL